MCRLVLACALILIGKPSLQAMRSRRARCAAAAPHLGPAAVQAQLEALSLNPDAGISILAGATMGGGTRINWQASFRTPAHVRREWATEHGLEAFNTPRYDRALDAVWQRIGVTTGKNSYASLRRMLSRIHVIPSEALPQVLIGPGAHGLQTSGGYLVPCRVCSQDLRGSKGPQFLHRQSSTAASRHEWASRKDVLPRGAGIKQHSGQNTKLEAGLQALGVHCGKTPGNPKGPYSLTPARRAGIKEHSGQNTQLKAGLQALGVHCGEIPRNCSPEHTCGHCCFGCPSGDKQDMTATFLPDAVAAGARILTGADTILGLFQGMGTQAGHDRHVPARRGRRGRAHPDRCGHHFRVGLGYGHPSRT